MTYTGRTQTRQISKLEEKAKDNETVIKQHKCEIETLRERCQKTATM
jgi:hypothetical protein